MILSERAYFTDDVPAMAAFYRALLDRGPVFEAEGIAIFQTGQVKVLIHQTYTPGPGDLPPENHIAFTVENVDEACDALASQGFSPAVMPRDYEWGRSAYLRDPDGNLIELTAA